MIFEMFHKILLFLSWILRFSGIPQRLSKTFEGYGTLSWHSGFWAILPDLSVTSWEFLSSKEFQSRKRRRRRRRRRRRTWKRVRSAAYCWKWSMASRTLRWPPGTRQTAPRISRTAIFTLGWSADRLCEMMLIDDGCANTCALPVCNIKEKCVTDGSTRRNLGLHHGSHSFVILSDSFMNLRWWLDYGIIHQGLDASDVGVVEGAVGGGFIHSGQGVEERRKTVEFDEAEDERVRLRPQRRLQAVDQLRPQRHLLRVLFRKAQLQHNKTSISFFFQSNPAGFNPPWLDSIESFGLDSKWNSFR